MNGPETILEQLSAEEIDILVQAAETNLLAFQPREDPVIASLLKRGLLEGVPDGDPSHETLIVSDRGREVAGVVFAERECTPT